MNNKIKLVVVFILVAILSYCLFVKFLDEDSWICTEAGWTEHGKPDFAKPILPCGEIEVKNVVENYLRENISNISTTKEVLGGKFSITKLNWVGNNSGMIEYEDGHILLKALFDYKIEPSSDVKNYSVIIENFKVIK